MQLLGVVICAWTAAASAQPEPRAPEAASAEAQKEAATATQEEPSAPAAPAARAEPADAASAPASAGATDSAPSDGNVEPVLALRVDAAIVDPAALTAALSAELGVAVTSRTALSHVIPTVAVARVPNGNVEVALSSRSIPRASREFTLRGTPEEQIETVALIAANLVRNEAAALLPDLRPRVAGEGAAPPAPVSEPEAEAPAEASPCGLGDEPFGADLAPGVGSSSSAAGRAAVRRFSLGLVGTYSAGLDGFEVSIGANIKRQGMCGAQIASGANVVLGASRGLQLANLNFTRGEMRGAQIGVLDIALGDFHGAQLGVAAFTQGSFRGPQVGVVSYAGGRSSGFQAGVATINLGGQEGFQGGTLNLALGSSSGFQGGVANLTVGGRSGLQAGVANVDVGETRGLQLGAVNVSTGEVHGAQIGVVNYADRSDASIGLLNIVRRGRTSADLTYSFENSLTMFGITHGGRYLHNLLGVGVRGIDEARLAFLYGLGVRAHHSEHFRLDVDALAVRLFDNDAWRTNTVIPSLRANLTYSIWRGIGVSLAPTYSVMITDDPQMQTKSSFGDRVLKREGKRRVIGYPGLTLGVHFEFDHGL